jgi:hypothetical protein
MRYGTEFTPRGRRQRGYDGAERGGYGREFQAWPDWSTQGRPRGPRTGRVWSRPEQGNQPRGAYDFGYDVTRGYGRFSDRGPYGGYFGSWDLRPMMAGYDRDLRHLRRRG